MIGMLTCPYFSDSLSLTDGGLDCMSVKETSGQINPLKISKSKYFDMIDNYHHSTTMTTKPFSPNQVLGRL